MEQPVYIVYAVRPTRGTDGLLKRSFALAYYWLMRLLTGAPVADSQADFTLVSRRVLDEVSLVGGDKVLLLLLPAIGFRSASVQYEALPRIAGDGRFGFRRQLRMARSSVFEYSSKPLRMVAGLGLALAVGALVWLGYVIAAYVSGRSVDGWASVMSAVLAVGGLVLLSLSLIGEDVARVHDILKNQPRYFIDSLD